MPERRKFKVIGQGPFDNLVRLLYQIISREKTPSIPDVEDDLKTLGISPESQFGPSAKKSIAKLKTEEKARLLKIKMDKYNDQLSLEAEIEAQRRLKAIEDMRAKDQRGDEVPTYRSPMADLGSGGDTGYKHPKRRDSDNEYKNE